MGEFLMFSQKFLKTTEQLYLSPLLILLCRVSAAWSFSWSQTTVYSEDCLQFENTAVDTVPL